MKSNKKLSRNAINLQEQRFGMLLVVKFVGRSTSGRVLWLCLCDCGKEHITTTANLRDGSTKSCGCYGKSCHKTHGMYNHQAYAAWKAARARVTRTNNRRWGEYGGRGIKMCDEWLNSFEAFWADMGDEYKESLTLDRIDVNGDYCKENCRWVDEGIQEHNKRKAKGCSSEYKGVYYDVSRNKFQAYIKYNGRKIFLGRFVDEYAAAIAYDDLSDELYGDRPNNTERKT